jgi:DNA polymerase-4
MRKVIHVDMDAFYASVEQRDQPGLRGRPVAVGGSGQRGVVAAASYEARAFGVHSAMSSRRARRLCPELIFVPARFELYKAVSRQIRAIYADYTDLVEPLSLDEAYLDVTHPKQGPTSAILLAREIRRRIREETGLTASAGISFNKFLAKVASDMRKPNGQMLIAPEDALAFLEKLPIEKFHGIGRVTAARMRALGIHTGLDLKQWTEVDLVRRFGKVGRHYYRIVRAQDERPVNPNRKRKSIGAERTFREDIRTASLLKDQLLDLCQRIFKTMKESGRYGRTISLKMKKPDFSIVSRSRSFEQEVRELSILQELTLELFRDHWEEGTPLRLLGVSVSNLSPTDPGIGVQLDLAFPNSGAANSP